MKYDNLLSCIIEKVSSSVNVMSYILIVKKRSYNNCVLGGKWRQKERGPGIKSLPSLARGWARVLARKTCRKSNKVILLILELIIYHCKKELHTWLWKLISFDEYHFIANENQILVNERFGIDYFSVPKICFDGFERSCINIWTHKSKYFPLLEVVNDLSYVLDH